MPKFCYRYLSLLLFCAACRSTPSLTSEHLRQAENASARGDWLAAGELWHRVWLENQARDPRYGLELARALYRQGDNGGASKVIEASLRQAPQHGDLLEIYGDVLVSDGRTAEALLAYEQLLTHDQSRPRAWRRLGELYLEAGDHTRALQALEMAARLEPHEPGVFLHIAEVGRVAQDREAELHALARAIQNGESDVAILLRAGSLGAERALSGVDSNISVLAIEWLERACALDPQRAEAWLYLGRLARLRLDPDRAIQHLRRAVELDPTDAGAITELAEVYMAQNAPLEAAQFVQRGLELAPEPELRLRLEALRPETPETEAESPSPNAS